MTKKLCSDCGYPGTYTDSQCYGCWLFSQPEWKVFDAAAQKKDQAAFQRQAPKGTWI